MIWRASEAGSGAGAGSGLDLVLELKKLVSAGFLGCSSKMYISLRFWRGDIDFDSLTATQTSRRTCGDSRPDGHFCQRAEGSKLLLSSKPKFLQDPAAILPTSLKNMRASAT